LWQRGGEFTRSGEGGAQCSARLVKPGGRLLVSVYGGPAEPSGYELLTRVGATVAGSPATTAWADA
jgi:hypothetical protein